MKIVTKLVTHQGESRSLLMRVTAAAEVLSSAAADAAASICASDASVTFGANSGAKTLSEAVTCQSAASTASW